MVNCVFLAIDNPNEPPKQFQKIADQILLGIYSLETLIKIIAMGFVLQPHSYLRDSWNIVSKYINFQLDFIVVIMGWLGSFMSTSSVSAIRVIRILRPLRTINSMPGMRMLVQSLLNSLPTLFDILILFSFVLVMFATIGTQIFGGLLRQRCFFTVDKGLTFDLVDGDFLCAFDTDCKFEDPMVGEMFQGEILTQSRPQMCLKEHENPDDGATSFDHLGVSILNVFILITLEGWTDIMYMIRKVTGTNIYDIYFLLTIIVGTFFVLNLMVAVQFTYLLASLDENDKKKKNQEQLQGDQSTRARTLQTEDEEEMARVQSSNDPDILPGCYERLSFQVKRLVLSKFFTPIVVVLILINTVFLSMEFHNMPPDLKETLEIGNTAFTVIFACEMVLKIVGLSFKVYIRDGFNIFDSIIVVIGLLELSQLVDAAGITVLRTFRLMRIFKIVKSWKTLRKLLKTVINSIPSIANLGLCMFLLVFIYSLIGMQFFGTGLEDENGELPRANFSTFGQSLLTIFLIMTGENWNAVMITVLAKYGFGASVYFVSLILFGNFMLLNLFLAILLKNIQDNVQDEKIEKEQKLTSQGLQHQLSYVPQSSIRNFRQVSLKGDSKQEEQNSKDQVEKLKKSDKIKDSFCTDNSMEGVKVKTKISFQKEEEKNEKVGLSIDEINLVDSAFRLKDDPKQDSGPVRNKFTKSLKTSKFIESEKMIKLQKLKSSRSLRQKKKKQVVLDGRSLFIFSPNNPIRLKLKSLISHQYFENLVYYLIALNSLLLALDEPALSNQYVKKTIDIMITFISCVFIVESLFKIIAMGFICGKHAYLKDSWNILDFLIVFTTVFNWVMQLLFDGNQVSFLTGFRALRALRPLRMVSKNEGMKAVVQSLLNSIPPLMNVLLISLLFYLVFGILAVQFFKGAMSECTDASIHYQKECFGQFLDEFGFEKQRQWVTPRQNFDNILISMLTLFEVSTLEMWPDIMNRAIDSTGIGTGPIRDHRTYVSLLFVSFIFLTTFFVMNLFISVIVDKFNELQRKKEGSLGLTPTQKQWVKLQRQMSNVKTKILLLKPENKFRSFFYVLVQSSKFELLITTCIILNTIFLCIEHYGQSDDFKKMLETSNLVFVIIFTLECALKMIGYGIKMFFLETWNKFDFVIVVLSILGMQDGLFTFNMTAFRIIRVARLLRMVKASKGLRGLIKTLWLSLPNIVNVGALLFLMIFTFAVAGMDLFGDIQDQEFINEDANFQTFYSAILVLVRASTGESWNGIMHDCVENEGVLGVFYWVVFVVIAFFIFVNVFIAVIYENFNDITSGDANSSGVLSVRRTDLKAFVKTWAEFNPMGEHFMPTIKFPDFLQKLPPPMGYHEIEISKAQLFKIIQCLNIKDYEGKVYFPEVMFSIFHALVGNNDEKVKKCEPILNLLKVMRGKYPVLHKDLTLDKLCCSKFVKNQITVSKYLNAMKIYNWWLDKQNLYAIDPKLKEKDRIWREQFREKKLKEIEEKKREKEQQSPEAKLTQQSSIPYNKSVSNGDKVQQIKDDESKKEFNVSELQGKEDGEDDADIEEAKEILKQLQGNNVNDKASKETTGREEQKQEPALSNSQVLKMEADYLRSEGDSIDGDSLLEEKNNESVKKKMQGSFYDVKFINN